MLMEKKLYYGYQVVLDKYTQILKDKKTGYGLPFRIDYEKECPGRLIENSMNNTYNGLKLVSSSDTYIYIYIYLLFRRTC